MEIEAVNGFTEEIDLNNRGVHLVDDAPWHRQLRRPGAELRAGTLTFLGELDQKATSLRLLVNTYEPQDTVDVASEYNMATAPAFQIDDIPIPGRT